jgi:hypothetical protein
MFLCAPPTTAQITVRPDRACRRALDLNLNHVVLVKADIDLFERECVPGRMLAILSDRGLFTHERGLGQ